ncbi:LOW QUALITY PROTEIN: uncharacterized protein LOC135090799 [Scylla paramamosain]|uniref:LOW QUALITY PROTEIN: uncharacterized protein LOC135090799 n=1 Tax=Scylla paramamosain TaxID=85552 RepID=UPI00308303D5
MLPSRFSGRVSVNHNLDNKVCLEMHVTACTDDDANLSYTVCTAPNLTALADYMHQRAVEERHSVGRGHALPRQLQHRSRRWCNTWSAWTACWPTPRGTRGHVLLPASWQTRPGELEFDPERFPDPVSLSQTLRKKGFHLALTLHPFVSVDAPGFKRPRAACLPRVLHPRHRPGRHAGALHGLRQQRVAARQHGGRRHAAAAAHLRHHGQRGGILERAGDTGAPRPHPGHAGITPSLTWGSSGGRPAVTANSTFDGSRRRPSSPPCRSACCPTYTGRRWTDWPKSTTKSGKPSSYLDCWRRCRPLFRDGSPLITPLALFVPHETEAIKVDDQWMLGDELLVAPVTRRGMQARDLYLPKGIWKDGITGNLRTGGRWIRDYPVPLTKIPYFILRPVDNFRR